MDLKGRLALVTGGGVRVGRAISLALAAKGARLAVHYRASRAEAESAAAEIRKAGGEAVLLQADLSRMEDVERLASEAERAAGGVDVLVNSASAFFRTPVEAITEADWDALLDGNLKGPFFLARRLGLAMRARGRGKIVNITDWAAERPYPSYLPYCISKAGLAAAPKGLARALAPSVQVNAVAPGPILPPPGMSESERAEVASGTLLGRWGSPSDIAAAVAFLCESDYITGETLTIDGGRSLAGPAGTS